MNAADRLSFVVPVFDEEDVIPELVARLRRCLADVPGGPHEVVLVDDGSTDRTLALLEAAAAEDPRFVVVALSRNFGHQAAICAGLDHATGDAVLVMDGDLQDPPETVHRFLAERAKGFDVVYARRVARKEGALLRAAYFVAYRLIAALSSTRLPPDAGDFALLSRPVVDALRDLPERQRYLRGLRTWVGFRQIGITVERHERFAGRPKYDGFRLVRLALDGMFAFSVVPLRAATGIGCGAITLAGGYALYALWAKLVLDRSPRGFTALTVAIVFLSGVQLLFLGVIGEYLGRVYEEVKARPLYVVERIIRR
ncbi:MAG TPA: glycosyltransferase family 2 protein [Candidatus Binatia bacterium]|nr:glycosyltransferase family 2 protein [Candidatus Binatia bacterium]